MPRKKKPKFQDFFEECRQAFPSISEWEMVGDDSTENAFAIAEIAGTHSLIEVEFRSAYQDNPESSCARLSLVSKHSSIGLFRSTTRQGQTTTEALQLLKQFISDYSKALSKVAEVV